MKKFELDIEIKDLLWEFVRSWRIIVVLAILCGVALGAYQYSADSNKTTVTTVKKTQEELETAMGKQDLDEVTAAVALLRQANQKSAYMESSELMKMDPYNANAVVMQYYVSAENSGVASDACDAYRTNVNSSMSELVTVTDAEAEHSFSVKVVGLTMENAEKLAEEVEAELSRYNNTVVDNIGVHQLLMVEKTAQVIVDQELAELQNANATAIKTLSNDLDKMKNEMTGDQISLYTYRTTTLATENNVTGAAPVEPASISVKHIIIGAIVGAILACGIIFVLYLFAPALRNAEEVKVLYGVKVLGQIDDSSFDKKRVFAFIDSWIEGLQNPSKKRLSYEQGIELASTNIILDCKKNGYQKIFLTSSAKEQIAEDVMSTLEKACEEKGIQVMAGDAICYNAKSVEELAKLGNVVFVEKKRVSIYDEMYREMLLCKENDIHVAGVVVLG